MFVRNGAVAPGPSRECDITFFVKRRPKSARQSRDSTVAARRAGCRTFKVARLQSELCTKDVFRATNFVTKNAPKFSPKSLSLCSVGQKKNPAEFPSQFSH